MSLPNDLEFVSAFAQQDIPAPVTATIPKKVDIKQEPTGESTIKEVDIKQEPTEESTTNFKEVDIKQESTEKSTNTLGEADIKQEITEIKTESMDIDTEPKDIIDAAISGEIKKEDGYESSDIELSSDEDESDDSSSSEEEDDEDKSNNKQYKSELLDEEEEVFPDGIVKTAHEIVDIVVEKPNFELTPETEIVMAGTIFQVINNVIVIHCRPGSEYNTLDAGSLLVYENRDVMGEVFETFGPIARPFYSVRFNDAKEINQELAKVGTIVYYVPSYQKTRIVETETLKQIKGTDASNVYDEEVDEEDMEFSDDEKELQFKKKKNREKKMRKSGMDTDRPMQPQHRQPRPPRDAPSDFDSALAAYEGAQLPPRQQQSYADLAEPLQPAYYYTPSPQQAQQSNYQSPSDLVSALFKSYNGQLPTQLPTSHLPASQTQQTIQHSQYAQPARQPTAQPTTQPTQTTKSSTHISKPAQVKEALKTLFAVPPPPIEDDA